MVSLSPELAPRSGRPSSLVEVELFPVSTVGRGTHEWPGRRQDSCCCVGGVNLSWPCTNTTTISYPASLEILSIAFLGSYRANPCMVPTSGSPLSLAFPPPTTLVYDNDVFFLSFSCTHNLVLLNFLIFHPLSSTDL